MGRRGENIRKRKDGRWEARIITGYAPDGKAKYRSLYGRTYLEAKEKRNDYLSNSPGCQKNSAAVRQPARKITVGQVMQEWLYSRKESVKESTYAHYTNLLEKHILPQLGEICLLSLTAEHINRFLREKLYCGRLDGKGGLSPKTVADIRSILVLGLEYAGQQHYPCTVESKIFAPKSRRSSMKVLSRKEQAKLEQYLCQHPDPVGLGILTALYGGVRIGELCALKWGDIYFDNGTVQISKTVIRIRNVEDDPEKKTRLLVSAPKTESSVRLVPLPSFIMEYLLKYRQSSDRFLLTGTKNGMEPRICLCKYKQILEKAGLESFTFHTLRHTFATRCIESGFDAKSLSEILGHANVNTTLRNYVHPSIELKKRQMERLKTVSIWGQNQGQHGEKTAEISSDSENQTYSVLL